MEHVLKSYGDYWIDYRHTGNAFKGVTRRWIETRDDFLQDLAQLTTAPLEVVAFGFKTVPPSLNPYGRFLIVPA